MLGGDKRNQVAAQERSEHQPGDLVDIWYDFPNGDAPGWGGPAQIVSANDGGGDITVRSQGRTLDRRHQEVGMHVPYFMHVGFGHSQAVSMECCTTGSKQS